MSWFQKHYEKAVLAVALILAGGLAYFGWSRFAAVQEDFKNPLVGNGKPATAVSGAEIIPKTLQSMNLDRVWSKGLDGDRPVDLFTGISLFIKSSEPEKPIDLLKDAPVHPPIPNTWWIENRLDPGFADSPNRDPDGDGFSNMEEFRGKTDPNNAKSYPPLVAKLMYVKDESIKWTLRPGYGTGGDFPFTYEDSKLLKNKLPPGELVKPGGMFYANGPAAVGRFKFLGTEIRKQVNPSTHSEEEVTFARVEDQRTNKKGKVYEYPAPLSDGFKDKYAQFDRTAVFSLEALGKNGQEFKVEENTEFTLPPGEKGSKYLLKTVTPGSVSLEFTDAEGKPNSIEISKGAMPSFAK
jgi:hypothetical protein